MTRSEIENESAFQYHRATLGAQGVFCLISAIALPLVYPEPPIVLVTALLVLSVVCIWIRFWILPIMQRPQSLDRIALAAFGGAAACNMISAAGMEQNSPISCGLVSVGTAFGFRSGWLYSGFVLVSICGQVLVRELSPFPVDSDYWYLLILTPIFCVNVFWASRSLSRHTYNTRKQLQDHVDELSRERERRIASEKKLIHAQKMEGLGIVAAGVAHDFNNYLQAIGAFAELIELGDDTNANAAEIRTATANAAEICKQMLAYAGKSAQQKQEPVDVFALLRGLKPTLLASLPAAVRLEVRVPNEPASVITHAASVRDCLLNVVKNAIEACDGAGRVRVTATIQDDADSEIGWRVFGNELPEGTCAVVEVADDGCGMAPDVLERAFDPYFTTKPTGHGFGLATSLGIVRASNGAIRVHSNGTTGTILQVILPIADSNSTQSIRVPTADATIPALAGRILVVDDDRAVRASVCRLLELSECHVTTASSGREALEILQDQRAEFDLILMDYSMPEMSGIELLEQIRERGIRSPAILCTGYAKEQIGSRDGVRPDGVLHKPYNAESLRTVIASTLGSAESQGVEL